MKFIVLLLVVLATSDAFLWGRFRSSDDNDAEDPKSPSQSIEEIARILVAILRRKLQDNNIKLNITRPDKTKPIPTFTKQAVKTYNADPVPSYNTEPVLTYDAEPVITYNTEPVIT